MWQAARTAGPGTRRPGAAGGSGGRGQTRRVLREAPPNSLLRTRKGRVTTVARAPPTARSASAMARNT
ncbi:hypothetical protein Sfr7A_23110 [Streptomyces xinghaiensis]|uniref:Uncharacterized protein n=1 Tax=Streptomyces xinghaiensis TaxID=1038928 RepID=A0A420UY91_9ACTN|nr:hypothetical protein Sfr7A_23110 [Streptomyces xinghaiensis]RKM92805.1 hypothetical protein SFRA_023060 [Streptomyces xinghaiensis]RNC72392.1 hypothetical protein DC095_018550 [Streptomyces xinghaiensis]